MSAVRFAGESKEAKKSNYGAVAEVKIDMPDGECDYHALPGGNSINDAKSEASSSSSFPSRDTTFRDTELKVHEVSEKYNPSFFKTAVGNNFFGYWFGEPGTAQAQIVLHLRADLNKIIELHNSIRDDDARKIVFLKLIKPLFDKIDKELLKIEMEHGNSDNLHTKLLATCDAPDCRHDISILLKQKS